MMVSVLSPTVMVCLAPVARRKVSGGESTCVLFVLGIVSHEHRTLTFWLVML